MHAIDRFQPETPGDGTRDNEKALDNTFNQMLNS